MKHKLSKRSTSNKHRHRSYQTQTRRLSISIDHTRTVSPNQINSGTGPAHLDSHTSCLKPNVPLKSQKLLKRDLLRCSNQRPSLLGPQILQPPRIHHGSQQTHSFASSSSSTSSSSNDQRRRSLSVNSRTFHATIDRIGPWPDISISRLHPDGNDLLRPLKTFRNVKNPCLFSPKYYAGLNDNTSKFKFHSSKRTYIEEYRKQKGYLLTLHSMKQPTSSSLSSSRQAQRLDDDQLSTIGTYSGVENYTARERTNTSTTNLSISTREITKSLDDILNNNNNHVPIISSVTNQINIFPSLPIRNNNNNNNNLRSIRHTQHHQTLTLPTLPNASVRYLNSMNPVEKVYADNKKISKENPSKLYFFDGRQNKRYLICFNIK
jgi:hypothetical protein